MLQKIKNLIYKFIGDEEKEKDDYDFYTMHSDALNRDWTEKRIEEVEKIEQKQQEKNAIEMIQLKQKLPLLMNDIITMMDGRKYKVCKKTIRGITTRYEVSLKWENRPNNYSEVDRVEQLKFGSLREMTYYLEQELNEIRSIKKSFDTQYEPFKTMDELQEEALIENERINKLKQKMIRNI